MRGVVTTNTAVRVPILDLRAQYAEVGAALEEAALRVLRSTRYIMGPDVEAFEREAAAYLGARHVVGVASGTDALVVALMALGVGAGDEVIVPPLTFIATAEAVRTAGATPVFADIEADTLTISPHAVERAATARTRAVIAVHLYGNPCRMDALSAVCDRIGAALVEDAAQAIGASHRGRRCGTLGRAAAFSCFPSKNLGACGDAGFLSTDDDEVAARARMIRVHGSSSKYRHEIRGLNARLDTLQAALLRAKLPYLDRWVEARRRVAARYREAFADLPLDLQRETDGGVHAYHLFTIRADDREALARHLADRGIETAKHYPIPLHRQPLFEGMGAGPGSFPASEEAAARVLSIPLYPEITDEQIGEVIAGVRSFFGR